MPHSKHTKFTKKNQQLKKGGERGTTKGGEKIFTAKGAAASNGPVSLPTSAPDRGSCAACLVCYE